MKIGFGNDHAGTELKEALMKHLKEKGFEAVDFGAAAGKNGLSGAGTGGGRGYYKR